MKKILVIDKDDNYCLFINDLLKSCGYHVEFATESFVALEMFKKNKYDLVISEIDLEGTTGTQLFSLLKKINPNIKLMILTNSKIESEEINALNLMLEEYLQKDISISVLLKRIEIIFLRNKSKASDLDLVSARENITINLKSRKIFINDEQTYLTLKEYEILVFLLSNKNVVFTREQILKAIWKKPVETLEPKTVDTHIKKIRAKLKINSIYSVRGVGYEWIEH